MLFACQSVLKTLQQLTVRQLAMYLTVATLSSIMIPLIVSFTKTKFVKSSIVVNKLCIPDYNKLPDEIKDKYDNMIGKVGIDDVAQYVADMQYAWPAYLVAVGTCLILT